LATATPAPNDPEELTSQAECLGVMTRREMLASYFIHDSDGTQNSIRLNLCSEKIYFDLNNLGCVEKKSLILKFPTSEQVPPEFIHHFIRGYFDGDGSITIHRNKIKSYQMKANLNMAGSLEFLESLKETFNQLGLSSVTKIYPIGKIHVLSFSGNSNVKKIGEILYKDATIFLQRKRDKMEEVFSYIPSVTPKKSKFPGVSWREDNNIWYTRVKNSEGKIIVLGYYTDELEAAEAYKNYNKTNLQ
ncbi:MAG: LAGLIDADG family homing endonuclease, partial [Nanoarchaeota archaeon]